MPGRYIYELYYKKKADVEAILRSYYQVQSLDVVVLIISLGANERSDHFIE